MNEISEIVAGEIKSVRDIMQSEANARWASARDVKSDKVVIRLNPDDSVEFVGTGVIVA
ncbi:hypothetical protein [Butyrivibrio sp. CB08]|uniref:hypothetical protein n=1 Tax=Butyrivibrio sp. CB08 TaxID=2364879 RepID=UPI001313FC31|nr:hypothetical protein [Butyrivibrio sp. CB08]